MILYASDIWKYTVFYYGFRKLWVHFLVLVARFYDIHNRQIILQESVLLRSGLAPLHFMRACAFAFIAL
jgi:hypothetical protein